VKSNIEWKAWGQIDPLWAVASWSGKNRGGASPWTDEEFYALGRADWADFLTLWNQYGLDKTSCVEIGCGAGRLTKSMALDFKDVHGIDVSQNMLDYARTRIASPNVHFHLSDGTRIPLETGSSTAAFSTHVFQHFNSSTDAIGYFQEISRVLTGGGTMMIHLPVYQWPNMPWLFDALYNLRHNAETRLARLQRILIERRLVQPIMRSTHYRPDFLFDSLGSLGFERIQISVVRIGSNGSLHGFVLATNGARPHT